MSWYRGLIASQSFGTTVVNTMEESSMATGTSSQLTVDVSEMADHRKTDEHSFLPSSYVFQPIRVEPFGILTSLGSILSPS